MLLQTDYDFNTPIAQIVCVGGRGGGHTIVWLSICLSVSVSCPLSGIIVSFGDI